MKKKFKSNFPVIAIAAAIALCLILTGLILAGHLKNNVATAPSSDDYLQNAYITSTCDGKICFLCDGTSYEYDGILSSDYTGIADIAFEDGKIVKIYTKSASISGTLQSYTDETVCISGYGIYEWGSTKHLACYVRQADGTVTEGDFSDSIVGTSEGEFIFENGSVCAVILSETETISYINVLLKNGDSIYRSDVYLKADAEYTIQALGASLVSCTSGEVISIASILEKYSLEECEVTCADGLLYLCDSDGNLLSEGYEGSFHMIQTENGFVLVNTLALEDYVRFVLPSEMPASFSYEALKAQAVCARTYACSQIKNSTYAEYGANLDDSTAYQVYNASGSNETMDQAVADTAGEVLTCDGALITCYYYSTSPGFTTTASVWGNTFSPSYLARKNCLIESTLSTVASGSGNEANAAVSDDVTVIEDEDAGSTSTEAVSDIIDYDLSDESALKDFLLSNPQSWDSASPFYRWTATVNLSAISDDSLGTLTAIQIAARNESGYVTELECIWENGISTICNENTIRKLLGAGLTELTLADGTTRDFSTIPSACFCITETNGTQITLIGGGFGHGVGMSQYGADALGDAGWSYEEILSFYYSGVSIRNQG